MQKRNDNYVGETVDRKAIFKEFINDNYPKYKDVAKKSLALVLHLERHAAKGPHERIDTYHELWGSWARRFLNFALGKKS